MKRQPDQPLANNVNEQNSHEVQELPSELWLEIFLLASLHTMPLPIMLELRTVCKLWSKLLCSMPKIGYSARAVTIFTRVCSLFSSLRALDVTEEIIHAPHLRLFGKIEELIIRRAAKKYPLPFSWSFPVDQPPPCLLGCLTQLKSLSVLVPASVYTPDLALLTNLTSLTLSSAQINSVSSLTNLTLLYLQKPFAINLPQARALPNLKTLITDDHKFFETGPGLYHAPNGHRYEGDFHNGFAQGNGMLYFPNGNKYVGEFQAHEMEGKGTLYYASGAKYEGEFVRNTARGNGVLWLTTGGRYEGEFFDGLPHGKGTFFVPGQGRYEGEVEHGRRKGVGVLYYEDGAAYQANWEDDKIVGDGAWLHLISTENDGQ